MTTLDELAASWDEKAAHWRRTAKQQRSACRTGDSTKIRLLEKAQLAEDCARELREAMVESAKLVGRNPIGVTVDDRAAPFVDGDGNLKLQRLRAPPDNHQDAPTPKARANRRIGTLSVDLDAKIQKFGSDIERAATLIDSEARESTADSGEAPIVSQGYESPQQAELMGRILERDAEAFKALADGDDLPAPPHKGDDSAG